MKGQDPNERCMLEQWVLLRPLLTLWQEASPLLFGKFSSGPSLNSCCPVRPAAASQAAAPLAMTFQTSRRLWWCSAAFVTVEGETALSFFFIFCLYVCFAFQLNIYGGRRFDAYSCCCSIIMWRKVETRWHYRLISCLIGVASRSASAVAQLLHEGHADVWIVGSH